MAVTENRTEPEERPEEAEDGEGRAQIYPGSLRERLRAKREELSRDRTFVLPVLGYEDDGLYARYRVLPYEQLRHIGKVNEEQNEIDAELATFADTLVAACVEILERGPDGSYSQVAPGWTADAVRDLFGVDLPGGATNRNAVLAVFAGPSGGTSANIALHFGAYDEAMTGATPSIDREVRGNSGASSA